MEVNYELVEALKQLEREKRIEPGAILEALESALAAAYKKAFEMENEVRVTIDPDTGEMHILNQEIVVKKGVESVVESELPTENFGRIAAQTAKQVVLQRLREAERDQMFDEYAGREGDIVTGIIEQSDHRYTLVDLGRVEALLPPSEQVNNERYDHGVRLKCYVLEVRKTSKDPQIIVSRSHPGLLRRLFELEVPEIFDGYVEIKAVAREAGQRSKIAVSSREPNIDPVGACVGPKGSRVRMVVSELKGEKIDIVEWNEDPGTFVQSALSPAKVRDVRVNEAERTAVAVVPDNQLSLAIGKEGQNARLAAKLTGWRIDIKSESEIAREARAARGEAEPAEEAEPVEEAKAVVEVEPVEEAKAVEEAEPAEEAETKAGRSEAPEEGTSE